jgi:transposase
MSALATRAHIHRLNQRYLCPLALTGKTAEEMSHWIEVANQGEYPLQPIYRENDPGEHQPLAEGYAFERTVKAEIVSDPQHPDQTEVQEWTEQVFVVRSDSYRQALLKGLDGRLQRATDKLLALTPPPARGKRQFQDETELRKAADAILKAHAVEGLLLYTLERQEKRQTKYLGRGRGNAERPTHEIVMVRYQITAVVRHAEAITSLQQTFGWRAYVTNAAAAELTMEQAVLTYRDEWLIEHGFHRLKGAPLSLDPLFVKRDDQVIGLINLLSLAVRFLTLIEFVVRRRLRQNQEQLTGLIENNPKKGIDNPTTERLLKMFDDVTRSIVPLPDQTLRHITPLTALQTRILELLGLSTAVYTRLAEN